VPAGQCYHCHTGRCPVGITTQDPELRKRLHVEEAANRVYNFLHTLTLEVQMLARACGKTNVHSLEPEDLCALTVEAAPKSIATAAMQLAPNLLNIVRVKLGGWKPETGRAVPDVSLFCIDLPFMFVRQLRARVSVHFATKRTLMTSRNRMRRNEPFSHDGCDLATRSSCQRATRGCGGFLSNGRLVHSQLPSEVLDTSITLYGWRRTAFRTRGMRNVLRRT